jgi:hypothetical protein
MKMSDFKFSKDAFWGATRVVMMAFAIALVTVSCGKDDDDDSGDDGGDTGKETGITAANWQQIIKDAYGFDLTVPSGWTFKQGQKTNINPSYTVQFTTTAADFSAAFAALMQHVFDLTASVVPAKGNYSEDGVKLNEIPTIMGVPYELWYFDTPKLSVQVSFVDAEATKTAAILLTVK